MVLPTPSCSVASPVPLTDALFFQSIPGNPYCLLSLLLLPLAVLIVAIPTLIYHWQDGPIWSWRNAFTSSGVPYAMTAAGFVALAAAYLAFPKERRSKAPHHMIEGAASLIPALVILVRA